MEVMPARLKTDTPLESDVFHEIPHIFFIVAGFDP